MLEAIRLLSHDDADGVFGGGEALDDLRLHLVGQRVVTQDAEMESRRFARSVYRARSVTVSRSLVRSTTASAMDSPRRCISRGNFGGGNGAARDEHILGVQHDSRADHHAGGDANSFFNLHLS